MGTHPLLAHRRAEVPRHVVHALEDARSAVGVVLEIPEHLGEVRGPRLELRVVLDWHAEHLGHDDARKRLADVRNHIHVPRRQDGLDEAVGNLLDVLAQELHSLRRESLGCQTPQPRVRGRIHEQHLLHHHLRNGVHGRQAHGCQLRGRGRAVGGKFVQHSNHIRVAGHDPFVQERIPMHGILGPQAAK